MWFQIWRKMAWYVSKIALKKKYDFKFLSFMCFYNFLHFFFKVILLTNIEVLPQIWDHILKTVFAKQFFFVFYSKLKTVYKYA